jgi:hypothetical protein
MNVRTRLAVALAAAAFTSACDNPAGVDDGLACTAIYVYGITVTVTDATTGAPVEGITAEIREGAYVDPNVTVFGNTVAGAGERAGVYTVTVRKEGYEDWTRSGVTVTADRCHVQGVALAAALVPKP